MLVLFLMMSVGYLANKCKVMNQQSEQLFSRLLRVPRGQAAEYESMLIYSNIGFMGLPVASSVLGPDSVLICPFLWRCSTFRYSPMVPS